MKTMEQLLNELNENKELAEKLKAVKDEQEFAEFLKENDAEGTLEDFKKLAAAKFAARGELSDDELDSVSGGGWWNSKPGYESGSTPVYKRFDEVVFRGKKGIIDSVSSEKHGWINKEFTYVIKYNDGTKEEDVYESQLVSSDPSSPWH
ncbi:MAG: hypothetical protein ACI4WS_01255 [Oscillospiraceae bacterium]